MSGGVLGGDDDGVQAYGLVAVVLDGDLRLAVGAQVGQAALLADGGQAAREAVGEGDGQRHQLGGVVAGVAEHQALVAGALLVEVVRGAVDAVLVGGVDALRDIGRLGADGYRDAAGSAVESLGRGVVSDAQDGVADNGRNIGVGGGGDFARDMHLAGGDQGFDGDAGAAVLGEERVEDGVADLVGDFVGMAFGDRLRGEQATGHAFLQHGHGQRCVGCAHRLRAIAWGGLKDSWRGACGGRAGG
ncbi:hypothetical protein GCM10020000_53180 [Streptomyces olivoverticillatus]